MSGPEISANTRLEVGEINDAMSLLVDALLVEWLQMMGTYPFSFRQASIRRIFLTRSCGTLLARTWSRSRTQRHDLVTDVAQGIAGVEIREDDGSARAQTDAKLRPAVENDGQDREDRARGSGAVA